jgi:cytochrome c556
MDRIKLPIGAAVALTIAVTLSAAAMTGTDDIKQRQQEMKGVYNAMTTFAAIAKKEQPFDAEVVHASAGAMADHLAKSGNLFIEGSAEGEVETWAKPEIWTDRAKFDELMESTYEAALAMQSVTDAKDFPPALGQIGSGCKNCHNMYRRPKD